MKLDYKAIGKRIKFARIQTDITQEHLAELASISPSCNCKRSPGYNR